MTKLKDSLGKCMDGFLDIRGQLGVELKDVAIVTRAWSGDRVGEGHHHDAAVMVKPKPAIRQYSHDMRLTENGAIKSGDVVIEKISKEKFPDEDLIYGRTGKRNCEIFYQLDCELYTVISVVEHLYWWDVQVRRLSSQRSNVRG